MCSSDLAGEEHKRRELRKLDALLGWCEVTDCRRRPLLAYFGETLAEDCGNCDNCLTPPATFDGTDAARKLLSAVYRTGQMFGAAHVIDVLLGSATEKVQRHRHDQLAVFGLGVDWPAQTWRSLLRQLIVRGYVQVDHARYGALVLTDASRPLLRGEVEMRMREDARVAPASRRKSRAAADVGLTAEDEPLWQALRDCRKRLAQEHNVPPYVIFHDATLREMLRLRPDSREALLGIAGVGQAKLERYGEDFLSVLRGPT